MEFHPQVHRGLAKKDGLTPDNFQWEQWPISNLTMGHPVGYKSDIALICKCDMPGDIPQPNQYDENDQKLPDPVGIAFSRVKFQLYTEDGDKLAEGVGGLHEGESQCGFSGRELDKLWKLLKHRAIPLYVRLVAFPLFMYLKEDGSMMAAYANANQGYFSGKEIESKHLFKLKMNQDGDLLINNEPPPEQKEPEPNEEDIRSREEGDRIMREEREAQERMEREEKERVERENREHNERMEREKREQEEEQRKARDEADERRKREDAEHQRMKEEAARERERLGIKPPSGDIWEKLTNPPNDDGIYGALLNLWTGQYDPDEDGYRERLKEIRKNAQYKDAVDEVCRRLGWTI